MTVLERAARYLDKALELRPGRLRECLELAHVSVPECP